MKCKVLNCESEELVYSGVAAFMLGIPTESICYDCGNKYAQVSEIVKAHYNPTLITN
jgi:hypothetical protein